MDISPNDYIHEKAYFNRTPCMFRDSYYSRPHFIRAKYFTWVDKYGKRWFICNDCGRKLGSKRELSYTNPINNESINPRSIRTLYSANASEYDKLHHVKPKTYAKNTKKTKPDIGKVQQLTQQNKNELYEKLCKEECPVCLTAKKKIMLYYYTSNGKPLALCQTCYKTILKTGVPDPDGRAGEKLAGAITCPITRDIIMPEQIFQFDCHKNNPNRAKLDANKQKKNKRKLEKQQQQQGKGKEKQQQTLPGSMSQYLNTRKRKRSPDRQDLQQWLQAIERTQPTNKNRSSSSRPHG